MEAWFTTQEDLWLHLHVKNIRRTLSFYAHIASKSETNNPLSSKLVQCTNATSNNNKGKMAWHLKTHHSIKNKISSYYIEFKHLITLQIILEKTPLLTRLTHLFGLVEQTKFQFKMITNNEKQQFEVPIYFSFPPFP